MSLFSKILTIVGFCMFLTAIFYVAFGQVTVKKLRKNPKTKDILGLEYVSGWNIINVAQALAIPRSWSRKLEKSPLSSMTQIQVYCLKISVNLIECLGLFSIGY